MEMDVELLPGSLNTMCLLIPFCVNACFFVYFCVEILLILRREVLFLYFVQSVVGVYFTIHPLKSYLFHVFILYRLMRNFLNFATQNFWRSQYQSANFYRQHPRFSRENLIIFLTRFSCGSSIFYDTRNHPPDHRRGLCCHFKKKNNTEALEELSLSMQNSRNDVITF